MSSKLSISILVLVVLIFSLFLWKVVFKKMFSNSHNIKSSLYVRPHSTIVGPSDAKVIVSIFLDPASINSKSSYHQLEDLIPKYEGKVKIAIRYGAFFVGSREAISILEATRFQKLYKESRDIIFKYPSLWGDGHKVKPELIYVELEKIGVNIDKLKKDMEKQEVKDIVFQDGTDAHYLKVKTTPEYFVNGNTIESSGFYFLEDLIKREIELSYKQ